MVKKIKKQRTPSPEKEWISKMPPGDALKNYMERLKEQEEEKRREARERFNTKTAEDEFKFDKLRLEMFKKRKNLVIEKPPPFIPMEPIKKRRELKEMEDKISSGTFLADENTKVILENARNMTRMSRYNKAFINFNEFEKFSSLH